MNITIVAGSFDDAGGKRSGWAEKLSNAIGHCQQPVVYYCNGGTWDDLMNCFNLHSAEIPWWSLTKTVKWIPRPIPEFAPITK